MSINPLGVHFAPTHQGRHHYDFIRRMEPGIMKIVGSGQVGTPDVQIMADCYEAAPNALHVYRNQPLSEQHDFLWRDPVGCAVEHVRTLASELALRVEQAAQRGLALPARDQWMILGINEPVIELFPRNEDMSNYGEWLPMVEARAHLLDLYMATFMAECDKVALRSYVGNFSGGQPANRKPGDYATYDWFPLTRRALEGSKGRHGLGVHEYWDIEGPEENPDWWTWRWKHCDWDCKIAVLESGVDRQIRSRAYEGNRGWQEHMTPVQYVDQHRRYMRGCLTDPRFIGATPFTLDGDNDWWSFYIEPCMEEMIVLSTEMRVAVTPPVKKPLELKLPDVRNEKPTPQPAPTVPLPAGILDPLVAQAILKIESGGRSHGNDGRMLIRFEAHIFVSKGGNPALFRFDSQIPWADQQWRYAPHEDWRNIHTGRQSDEYAAFEFAISQNREAAFQSISMGAPQIMGFNHARIGYPSAEAMFVAFQDATMQTIGFLNFFLADVALAEAMRRKDWREIARRYNGAGAVDTYAPLLENAYYALGGQ